MKLKIDNGADNHAKTGFIRKMGDRNGEEGGPWSHRRLREKGRVEVVEPIVFDKGSFERHLLSTMDGV